MQTYFEAISSFLSFQISEQEFDSYVKSQTTISEDGVEFVWHGEIEAISENIFSINGNHALRLCTLVLEEKLSLQALIYVGVHVVDYDKEFPLQLNSELDTRSSSIIFKWYEIWAYGRESKELNIEHVKLWKEFLETGEKKWVDESIEPLDNYNL